MASSRVIARTAPLEVVSVRWVGIDEAGFNEGSSVSSLDRRKKNITKGRKEATIPKDRTREQRVKHKDVKKKKAKPTSDLRRRRSHLAHKARRIDNASPRVQTLLHIRRVLPHCEDRVLAAVPDTFDVDRLGEVPDGFLGCESVVVQGVHDAGVVELASRIKPKTMV